MFSRAPKLKNQAYSVGVRSEGEKIGRNNKLLKRIES